METVNEFFATQLRFFRKKQNLTQRELADRLSYSEKSIAKWESGTTMPSVEALVSLAAALHTDLNSLIGTKNEIYFLGIDAGGTKTRFRLCDADGNQVREVIGGGCNSFDIGIEKAQMLLDQGLREVCRNVPFESVVMFAGIAGGGIPSVKAQYHEFFKLYPFAAYDNGTDSENIIYAGLEGQEGITLILGTGVSLFKVRKDFHSRMAGWGYLFDEGGSGYNFGQDAIKAYFANLDGYGPKTGLSQGIEELTGCKGSDLITKLYAGGKRYIASLAPLVFTYAEEKNDPVAKEILDRNFTFVAKLIEEAVKDFSDLEHVPVVMAGGVTKQKHLRRYLNEKLSCPERVLLKILEKEPVEGAIMKAKALWNSGKDEKNAEN